MEKNGEMGVNRLASKCPIAKQKHNRRLKCARIGWCAHGHNLNVSNPKEVEDCEFVHKEYGKKGVTVAVLNIAN